MSLREDLREALRRSRRSLLAAVHDLPESCWEEAVGPWSVAAWLAICLEAENRALTLVQSLRHGRPFRYDLPEDELNARAVARRRGWSRDHLLRELYQQREETMITLADLSNEDLVRVHRLGEHDVTLLAILMAVATAEEALAARLRHGHAAAGGAPAAA
jgi:hypothetical protein